MIDKSAFITRGAAAWARVIVHHPGKVLAILLALGAVGTYLTTILKLESDQLALISQDLPEVKEVKKVIDMVGGAGYLSFTLRGSDEATLKKVSDQLYEKLSKDHADLGNGDEPTVRFITYKVPVDFIQENMVLFIQTEDLIEGKKRINAYLKDQIKRASPFYFEIRKTEPLKLNLDDLIDKYSHIGKKSVRDSYYISEEHYPATHEKQNARMMLMLVKPMWNSTELQKTQSFLEHLTGKAPIGQAPTSGVFAEYSKESGISLIEDYSKIGDDKTVYFGFTGMYKTGVDDSYAMMSSLEAVLKWALLFITIITIAFFRKVVPTVIVISGMALGTVLTMGFAKLTLGELNMVTSIIAAILAGFGVDYGIHFIYRTRIELGLGKRYDQAITDALINAGRPASVAAVVTGGSFMVLLVSRFRGFSQFGFLAGVGTLIIGFTLFSWSPAILSLIGSYRPEWVAKLIGVMEPPKASNDRGEIRIPRPRLMLGLASAVVAAVCFFAVPKTQAPLPKSRSLAAACPGAKTSTGEAIPEGPSLWQRFMHGVTFNYNTRALVPEDQPSIILQDEINCRFAISSDPVAVITKTLEEAKEVYDELTLRAEKYPTIDQVVSIYSFVPPPKIAEANAKVLAEWQDELKDIPVESLPPEMQEKAEFFKRILARRPFGVEGVPDVYAQLFRHLPTTRPENHGYLTFIYPSVDLWDGKTMMEFADQVRVIKTESGREFQSAGLTILYATLAKIVLFDGKFTVLLATLWILFMHYLDFRSVKLAAASVIPLGVGLWMMLGVLPMTNHRLNFMNLVILPILLGFGVSHGLYLLHRFLEGTSPVVALRSVGAAVASSTLTAIAGFASLFFASHNGLQSIGYVACVGLATTLVVSFTVLAAVLELIHEKRLPEEKAPPPARPEPPRPEATG